MPINELSNIVRIPRLGKLHLGVKAQTTRDGHPVEYPKATDYFVCPDEVKEVYGDKPKALDIMLPVEDPEVFAPQYLKAYSLSQGLICRGNGVKAQRKIDLKTGAVVDQNTKSWDWREVSCDPQECELYMKKSCRQVMNLLFLLPRVPGLGVYQVDTSSYHSIINVNSMVRLLKGIVGRCSMIPLTLILRSQEVNPQGTTKKTVHVLDIWKDITLSELAKTAMLPPAQVLMPEVTEEMPEDLYPAGVLSEGAEQPPSTSPKKKQKSPEPPEEPLPPEGDPLGPVPHSEEDAGTKPEPSPEKLIERIHIEASNIGKDYYENVIRPKIQATFEVDSSKKLTIKQLNLVLDWMIGKASGEEKRAFGIKMKDMGFTKKEDVVEQINKYTGKTAGWTRGDLDKVLLASRAEKSGQKDESPSDDEIDNFLSEEE